MHVNPRESSAVSLTFDALLVKQGQTLLSSSILFLICSAILYKLLQDADLANPRDHTTQYDSVQRRVEDITRGLPVKWAKSESHHYN